jgi:hypothetical protein
MEPVPSSAGPTPGFPSPAGSLVHRLDTYALACVLPGQRHAQKEILVTVPAVRKQDPAGRAVSSSPRRGIGGYGIAWFMLGGNGSATAPVVHDHRAGGGQGGAGRPVVVAAQQQID